MTIELRQHEFGGPFLWIPPESDLTVVESPYRELLSDELRAAYTNTAAYFNQLAEACTLDTMKNWFAEMAKAGRCGLQIHTAAMWRVSRNDVIVRGYFLNRPWHSDFRIQTSDNRPYASHLPNPLRTVFELIDGTIEFEAWAAGGLTRIDNLYYGYLESGLPIEEGTPPELLKSPIFYHSECGDRLVACDGIAYWYLHEICGFRKAGELSKVVSDYFLAILEGRSWLSDPYANL